jgi:integrase
LDQQGIWTRSRYKGRYKVGLSLPGFKTRTSGAVIARYAIPADVRDEYRRLYGKGREERWRVKPGEPEWPQRKQLYGEWVAKISRQIEAIRAANRGEGITLSRHDAAALAGEWYQWFVARHEDAPGNPKLWEAEQWSIIDAMLQYAPEEVRAEPMDGLKWTRDPEVRKGIQPVLADRGYTAQLLASKGVVLTNAARDLFLDFAVDNYIAALSLLEARARNDYSPDDLPATFPKFLRPKKKAEDQSPWKLFESWVSVRKPSASTVTRWRGVFTDLEKIFSGPSAEHLTEDTAQTWAREKITPKRTPITVKDVWVNAAHTVYAWAKSERLITSNPFEAVSVTVPRKVRNRDSAAFSADEARTILRAAMAISDTKRASNAAKRWVPWLCAYSGARVGEMTQLRGVDIVQRGNFHAMRITPEAGTVKTKQAHTVPLHEHIVEQGFLEYVQSRGKGPLFYDPDGKIEANEVEPIDPMKPKRTQAKRSSEELAYWVRRLGIKDPEVQPNHAWRHMFKQIAERSGIGSRVHDVITGHSADSVAAMYTKATVEDMAEALKKFPRYEV